MSARVFVRLPLGRGVSVGRYGRRPTVQCRGPAHRPPQRRCSVGNWATSSSCGCIFIVTLLGWFIPTPGGVGVIEAGLTGALVAAGAPPAGALAAVLVYRAITYVMPIMIGAAMYVVWRTRTGNRCECLWCVESADEVLALPPASLAAAESGSGPGAGAPPTAGQYKLDTSTLTSHERLGSRPVPDDSRPTGATLLGPAWDRLTRQRGWPDGRSRMWRRRAWSVGSGSPGRCDDVSSASTRRRR